MVLEVKVSWLRFFVMEIFVFKVTKLILDQILVVDKVIEVEVS